MKTLFVPAKSKVPVRIPASILAALPDHLAVVTTVQYHHIRDEAAAKLTAMGKKVYDIHGSHSKLPNQVLGCNTIPEDQLKDIEALLYIGTGVFHPKALAIRTKKPIHIFHPLTRSYEVLDQEEVKRVLGKEKAAFVKFLSSNKVGVLITTKPGQFPIQMRLREMRLLEGKYPDKEFYYFVDNSFNYSSLENFPFIECFLNTACPNIAYDPGLPKPMLNIEKLSNNFI